MKKMIENISQKLECSVAKSMYIIQRSSFPVFVAKCGLCELKTTHLPGVRWCVKNFDSSSWLWIDSDPVPFSKIFEAIEPISGPTMSVCMSNDPLTRTHNPIISKSTSSLRILITSQVLGMICSISNTKLLLCRIGKLYQRSAFLSPPIHSHRPTYLKNSLPFSSVNPYNGRMCYTFD